MIDKVLNKNLFYQEFSKLKKKVEKDPTLLDKFEVNETVTLSWLLDNQDFVISEIFNTLQKKGYKTPVAKEKLVVIKEKERLLYGFDWHEKVLQGVIAEVLTKHFEPILSENLNSYRKGRGPYATLLKLCEFLSGVTNKKDLFVIKKDIKSYGDTIDHEILFSLLSKYLPKEDYIVDVLRKIIQFDYIEYQTGIKKQKKIGMPTGSPINNVMVNFFLSDMDSEIDKLGGQELCYFRYGDDIFIASKNRELAKTADDILNSFVSSKALIFNEEKNVNDLLGDLVSKVNHFKYLGLVVSTHGRIGLTKEKEEVIKHEIEKNLKKVLVMLRDIKLTPREKIDALIKASRTEIAKTDLFSNLSSYFIIVNDDDYWKSLDLWVAETILRLVYKRKTGKNFDRCSYKDLRTMKLPSLVHARRLYLRNHEQFREYLK